MCCTAQQQRRQVMSDKFAQMGYSLRCIEEGDDEDGGREHRIQAPPTARLSRPRPRLRRTRDVDARDAVAEMRRRVLRKFIRRRRLVTAALASLFN